MEIRQAMDTRCPVINEQATALDAARQMADDEVGILAILDEGLRLCGVVTDRDLIVRVMATGKNPAEIAVSELADGVPTTVRADDPLEEAARRLEDAEIQRLLVLDERSQLVGVIAREHIYQNGLSF